MTSQIGIGIIVLTLSVISFGKGTARADSPVNLSRPLKVLQLNFNDELVPSDHGDAVRSIRLPIVEKAILDQDIDVIFLEEAWNYKGDASVGETIARDLGYDVAYRVGMGFPFVVYDSNVILAKKSLHLSSETDVKLPHSAGQIGGGKNSIVVLGAISYGVGVKLEFEGQPLYAYATHLIGWTDEEKKDQLLFLAREIDKQIIHDGGDPKTAHVVIGADLNLTPATTGVKGLISEGYLDAFGINHPDEVMTCTNCGNPHLPWFNPFNIVSHLFPAQADWTENDRNDYIFLRGQDATPLASTLVFTAPFKGVYMSDHYGLISSLAFDPAAASLKLANPLRDTSDDTPATVLTLTDEILTSGQLEAPLEVNSFRGLAVINESSQKVNIKLNGPATIYNVPDASIAPNEGTAFTFAHRGEFTIDIRGTRGLLRHHDHIRAQIRVLTDTAE